MDLDERELPVARRLIAGAFADEPFAMGMYGDRSVDRLIGLSETFAEWPASSDELVLGVRREGVLLAGGSGRFRRRQCPG